MGRIRTRSIKTASKKIISLHYKKLDFDFYHNRRVISMIAVIQSKKLLNKVAGFVTHLMKRIQTSTVTGIHIKEHEEEKERKENFIPKNRVLNESAILVDTVTSNMCEKYEFQGNYMNYETLG